MTPLKSKSRHIASKSPVEQVTVCKVADPTELKHERTNEASAKARDEPNPVQSLAPNPVESFVTSVISEAADMVKDIKTIISMDDNKRSGKGNTRALQPASEIVKATESPSGKGKARPLQSASKVVKVKGSPFTLSRLIKTLDKQEREVEKLHKQLDEAKQEVMGARKEKKIKKLEQQLNKAEQKVMDTRSRMKALGDKFELRGILNDIDDDDEFDKRLEEVDDDDEFDERLEEVLEDGIKVVSYAGEELLYFTKLLMSTMEKTAREALFPYGADDDETESQTEYGTDDESESDNFNERKNHNQSENQSEDRVEDSSNKGCEDGVNPKRLTEVEASNGIF